MKLLAFCIYMFLSSIELSTASKHTYGKINPHFISLKLSASNNEFAIDLLKDISKLTPKNLIICPISIYTTLGMLHFGARAGTSKELERTLRYDYTGLSKHEATKGFRYLLKNNLITLDPTVYVLDIANTILVNEKVGLSSAYKSKVEKFFKARVELADFDDGEQEVLGKINGWVRNMTRGKIPMIINYIDKSMDVIALNAAYFKSRWDLPFIRGKTRPNFFHNAGTTKSLVSMMEQQDNVNYYSDKEVSVIDLPFSGKNISMLVVLPHKYTGLVDLEKKLSYEKLATYAHSTQSRFILVHMPKFNITFYDNLVPNLNRLGARKMFQPSVANFTGMVPHETIALGEVRHKAIIEVDEDGVEAAGVTAVLGFKSMPLTGQLSAHFLANHPFAYFILDKRTDLILFMGHVWNL